MSEPDPTARPFAWPSSLTWKEVGGDMGPAPINGRKYLGNWGFFTPINRVITLNTTSRGPLCGWGSGFLMTWKNWLVQGPTEIREGFMVVVSNIFVFCASLDRKEKTHFDEHLFIEFKTGVKPQKECFAGDPTPSKRKPKTNQSSYKKHQKHHRPKNLLQPTVGYPKKRQNCKTNLQAKTPSRQLLQTLHVNG